MGNCIYLIVFFKVCFLSFAVQAQVVATPQWIVKPGESIKLIVDAEREATLYLSHTEPYSINYKVEIAENLCVAEFKIPSCSYRAGATMDHLAMRWSKHNDPTKIGQTVNFIQKYVQKDGTPILDNAGKPSVFTKLLEQANVVRVFGSKFIGFDNGVNIPADELTCDSWDWLGSALRPDAGILNLQIDTWSSERMSSNAETQINENQTDSTYENVTFSGSGTTLKLEKFDKYISSSANLPLLTLGPISTLQIGKLNSNESCQISLSHNFNVAGIDFQEHYKKSPNFKIYTNVKSKDYKQLVKDFSVLFTPDAYTKLEFE